MTDRPLQIGIIGAGRMGITHHSIINAHPAVEVVAVADPSTVMTTILSKYVKVRTYKDATSLLKAETLDALLVCTPPALNLEILEQALAKRLHVFIEKPFLLSTPDARAIASKFDEAGLVNQVGYVNRFNDIFAHLKRLVDAGVVGKPLRFRSEMYSSTVTREQEEGGWRAKHANGGGAVYEMASHAIDMVNFLFGRPDRIAGSVTSKVFSQAVEDVVSSNFLYKGGLAGSLYVNWSDASYRKPSNRLEVFGKDGKLIADQYGLKAYVAADKPAHKLTKGWNDIYITDVFSNVDFYVRGIEFSAQLYDFVDKIGAAAGTRSRCSFADAADTLSVIDDIFRDSSDVTKGLN
jgi:predicted dehydrogenase